MPRYVFPFVRPSAAPTLRRASVVSGRRAAAARKGGKREERQGGSGVACDARVALGWVGGWVVSALGVVAVGNVIICPVSGLTGGADVLEGKHFEIMKCRYCSAQTTKSK